MQYPAIDFKQLLRDEKLRARQERQRRSEQNGSSNQTDVVKETESATTKIGKPKIDPEETTIASSSEASSHMVALEIPDDWLNASSSSSSIDDDNHNVSFPIPLDRIQHCVSQDPPSIYYIPNFLPSSSQEHLKAWLSQLPHAAVGDNTSPNGKWTTLRYARRRVALLDGRDDGGLPRPIQQLALALVKAGIFSEDTPPNHVLINEYFEPSQGIMPHTDGPLYAPITATISMGGGDVLLNFTPRRRQISSDTEPTAMAMLSDSQEPEDPIVCKQVWLQGNGSLVVFTEDAYTSHLHGIDEHVQVEEASSVCANAAPGTPIVRGYRISLTFRHKRLEHEDRVEEA